MKKISSILFFIFFFIQTHGQNIKHFGKFETSLIREMTGEELLMYSECITFIGKDRQMLDWASEDVVDLMKKDPKHFKYTKITLDSEKNKIHKKYIKGVNKLGSKKLILDFERTKNKSTINLLCLW